MKVAKFGHVQRQPGRVDPELGDHAAGKPGLDLAQLPLAEAGGTAAVIADRRERRPSRR
jgi:hypothetical protein